VDLQRGDVGALGWFLLGLRFVLELSALAALAWWGFQEGGTTLTRIVLGVGAPAVAAVVWGSFVAPRARFEVPRAVRILIEALVFASAAVALVAVGRTVLAIAFAVLVLANSGLVHTLGLASIGRDRTFMAPLPPPREGRRLPPRPRRPPQG
jgi:hypothetical protein